MSRSDKIEVPVHKFGCIFSKLLLAVSFLKPNVVTAGLGPFPRR